jgi:hypothetical protein
LSELTSCIEHVRNMMSKTFPPVTLADIRPQIIRLFEEGVTMKPIVDLLVARQHTLHEEMVLGLRNPDHLSPGDIRVIERTLGVNELTPENREHWEAKFKSGRARYWCPQCGYAGNDEFRNGKSLGLPNYIACYQCSYLEDSRYFSRGWTPEQQAAFEGERQARRAASEAKRIAESELKSQRGAQVASVRQGAIKVAREIELHQWLLNGDEEDTFSWDERQGEKRIRTVTALMLRPLNFGGLPIPADDLIAYFKANLKPPEDDDLQAAQTEFSNCALSFDKMTMETNHD